MSCAQQALGKLNQIECASQSYVTKLSGPTPAVIADGLFEDSLTKKNPCLRRGSAWGAADPCSGTGSLLAGEPQG
jgi:hypothetical protein